MHKVLVAGAGKIGSFIAFLLTESQAYEVHLADLDFKGSDVKRLLSSFPHIKTVSLDVTDHQTSETYLRKHQIEAVICSLPFFLNIHIAQAAKAAKVHYFDLTEDIEVTKEIKALAKQAESAFVPQCGLAPGFIGIAANNLIQHFESCRQIRLRVGALPERVNNGLHYSLTWSTEGLVNLYCNPCFAVENGKLVMHKALEGLESIQLDGCHYEAFNTSGGLGHLAELHPDSSHSMNYKTIRYPGHCEKIRFLIHELRLGEDRPTLKRILEHALPKTYQDLVLIYVSVEGMKHEVLTEKSYYKKLYPKVIGGLEWSAIQVSTASGVCAVVDLLLNSKKNYKGLIYQEQFPFEEILNNRFGSYYKEG